MIMQIIKYIIIVAVYLCLSDLLFEVLEQIKSIILTNIFLPRNLHLLVKTFLSI